MIKATLPLSLLLLLATPAFSQQAPPAGGDEIREAVKRQADYITLHQKLEQARVAVARHDYQAAASLYDAAWGLIVELGPYIQVHGEVQETKAGLASVRLTLAEEAQKHHRYREAKTDVDDVLRVDPQNPDALQFRVENDKLLAEAAPYLPSPEGENRVKELIQQRGTNVTRLRDATLMFEMGQLDEAEAIFNQVVREDPDNRAANYYLNLIKDKRYGRVLNGKELVTRQSMVDIEKEWLNPPSRDLPIPNPYARTNLIWTSASPSRGKQVIMSKLDRIRMDNVKYEGLPLSEVIINLNDEAKKRDPERRGINFIINPNSDVGGAAVSLGAPGAIDPATGLPIPAAAPAEAIDVGATSIKILPPLNDVRMAEVLDAIVKVADKRIKYSIEDYAVVFSLKGPEQVPLFTRIIRVDPNTFEQGLESVVGLIVGGFTTSTGGGGGGGGGGGAGGQGQSSTAVPQVQLASGTTGGAGGGGGGIGAGQGRGVRAVTRTNDMTQVQNAVRLFFQTMGVDLTPPKNIFFNDREGSLLVHASIADLDLIEQAVQVLNTAAPQINIKAKFIEVTQNDSKALGFDYYLGNVLMNNGSMGLQGGTAPSFSGSPSTANPLGSFPSPTVPVSPTDQLLTSGLRNVVGVQNPVPVPALGTLTGILTDPQFRVVLHALEQRDGVDLLNESSVTTVSGRQCQIQVVDLQTIVTGTTVNQTAAGGGGVAGGNGVIGSTVQPTTQNLPFGPTLDVVPYVSADGFTIQMTIIPTIIEFIGYDDPQGFVIQAQSGGGSLPVTAQLPLPHLRLRQVTTSANVWDGQTVVLGGLITENVVKIKDKIPVLGDLPILGRAFRSESSQSSKKNLMIFVTPTIIDPAGNPMHSLDEMPFAQNAIPGQGPRTAAQ
jgi:general secretion pathway protein D